MKVWIEGKVVDGSEARVPVTDHGLLYGDGIFEGIRIYNGKIFKEQEHLDRLYESAKCLLLEIPMTHEELSRAMRSASRRPRV